MSKISLSLLVLGLATFRIGLAEYNGSVIGSSQTTTTNTSIWYWWYSYYPEGNPPRTDSNPPTGNPPLNGTECLAKFGRFCTSCNQNRCLSCQSTNFTLKESPYEYDDNSLACVCQAPYVLNLTKSNLTRIQELMNLYSGANKTCILCTDKFTLDDCIPALYSNYSNVSQSSNASVYSLVLTFNRQKNNVLIYAPVQNLPAYFSLYWDIDGTMIQRSRWVIGSNSDNFSIVINITGLSTLAQEYFTKKNYPINDSFTIQVRRNYKIYFNATGNPIPFSYKTYLRFKSRYGGFSPDTNFTKLMNGTEAILFTFSFNQNTTNTTNTTNITNTSNQTNNSNANQREGSYEINQNEIAVIQSNNLGIIHNFTRYQIISKQVIQIGMTALTSLGLMGTAATNWLTLTLSMTQSFNKIGFYAVSNNSDSSNPAAISRLLTQIKINSINSYHMLEMLANLTLVYNPLILYQPSSEEIYTYRVFPSYSQSLAYTYFLIIVCTSALGIFLLYINGYTRGKTHYDHSHIFKTLSERNMVKRVVFIVLRGVYPIFVFAGILLISDIIQLYKTKRLSNIHLYLTIHQIWNLIYVTESLIFLILSVTLPLVGILVFNRYDKHNIYIYSRMYAEEQPKEEKQQKQNSSSSSSDQGKSHTPSKIKNGKATLIKMGLRAPLQDESCLEMNGTTTKFLTPESVKDYKGSIKPLLYFLYEFFYIQAFLIAIIFVGGVLQNIILLGLASFYLLFTIYCAITVCVSKAYAVTRIVEIGLVVGFLVCRFLWNSSAFAAAIAFYLMYIIGATTLMFVIFNIISMIYWEKKGLGVFAFFVSKVNPTTENFGEIEIQQTHQVNGNQFSKNGKENKDNKENKETKTTHSKQVSLKTPSDLQLLEAKKQKKITYESSKTKRVSVEKTNKK